MLKAYIYTVTRNENADPDIIGVTVDSTDAGDAFAQHILDALKDWYDGAAVELLAKKDGE